LEQVKNNFKGELDIVEAELEFCITMMDRTDDKEKWLFFFDKPIHMKWIREWCTPGPIISSVFPWFDSDHDWTAMRACDYLRGANNLVGAAWLFAKIAHPNARLVIEEVTRWKTLVKDGECGSLVDRLHLELSAMKLGILIPKAEGEVVTVPASLDVDSARQLLKRKGDKSRKTYDGYGAFEALQAHVSRPAKAEGGRGTRGRKPPAEPQPPPARESLNVGDEVIITAKKIEEVRNTNNFV
jgi:hypothetical protein